jgi:hypothetical protein
MYRVIPVGSSNMPFFFRATIQNSLSDMTNFILSKYFNYMFPRSEIACSILIKIISDEFTAFPTLSISCGIDF